MNRPFDAIVVGTRCAGAPVAMLLARGGYRVLAVDRATFPSDTVSTHVVHPAGVATLSRWGLLDALVATGCPPIRTYAYDFGPIRLEGAPGTAESPVAYCPRRTVLDKLLVDAAAAAGAIFALSWPTPGTVRSRQRSVAPIPTTAPVARSSRGSYCTSSSSRSCAGTRSPRSSCRSASRCSTPSRSHRSARSPSGTSSPGSPEPQIRRSGRRPSSTYFAIGAVPPSRCHCSSAATSAAAAPSAAASGQIARPSSAGIVSRRHRIIGPSAMMTTSSSAIGPTALLKNGGPTRRDSNSCNAPGSPRRGRHACRRWARSAGAAASTAARP